jgi:hypothetical protein
MEATLLAEGAQDDTSSVATSHSEKAVDDCADDDSVADHPEKEMGLKEKPPPVSFSQIDTSLDAQVLQKQFPEFTTVKPLFCDIKAGQMLYLPVGWFHEVISSSAGSGATMHMAFNFWFHPPNKFDDGAEAYPYQSQFWAREYASRGLGLWYGLSVSCSHRSGEALDAEDSDDNELEFESGDDSEEEDPEFKFKRPKQSAQ